MIPMLFWDERVSGGSSYITQPSQKIPAFAEAVIAEVAADAETLTKGARNPKLRAIPLTPVAIGVTNTIVPET